MKAKGVREIKEHFMVNIGQVKEEESRTIHKMGRNWWQEKMER